MDAEAPAGRLELEAGIAAGGVVGVLANAALAATGVITATGFVSAADGGVASSLLSREQLMDYLERLHAMSEDDDFARLAYHVHHVLVAVLTTWHEEFESAGLLVLPLLLILVARRLQP